MWYDVFVNITNQRSVLVLNANWQGLRICTVQDAIVSMNSCSDNGSPAALALDISYEANKDGTPNYGVISYMQPLCWEEWIKAPIRQQDKAIHTCKMAIRVPTVIIVPNFNKMPVKVLRPTKQGIRARDKDICQLSGRKLKKSEGNIDHILARSKGGKETWTNLIYVDKDLNSKKGSKSLEEMGWKPIREPKAPLPIPASQLIEDKGIPDWGHFLIK